MSEPKFCTGEVPCDFHSSASAVPVGVHPEPAERPDNWLGVPHDRLYPLHCGECWDRSQGRDRSPAVPVVHPEPGDRAAKWREEALDAWYASDPTGPVDSRVAFVAGSMQCLADMERRAEVAAAVAAVRADTVAQIDSLDTWLAVQEFFMTDSPWYDPRKGLSRLRALLGAETPGVQPLGQTGQRAGQTRRTGPAEEPE